MSGPKSRSLCHVEVLLVALAFFLGCKPTKTSTERGSAADDGLGGQGGDSMVGEKDEGRDRDEGMKEVDSLDEGSADSPRDNNLWTPSSGYPRPLGPPKVLPNSKGGFTLLSEFSMDADSEHQLVFARYDADGSLIHTRSPFDEDASTIEVSEWALGPDEDVIMCGVIGAKDLPHPSFPTVEDDNEEFYFFARIDEDGRLDWVRELGTGSPCSALDVRSDGRISIVARDGVTLQFSKGGELNWEAPRAEFDGVTMLNFDEVAFDTKGNVRVIYSGRIDAPEGTLNTSLPITGSSLKVVAIESIDADGTLTNQRLQEVDQRSTGTINVASGAVSSKKGDSIYLRGASYIIDLYRSGGVSTSNFGSYLARLNSDGVLQEVLYPREIIRDLVWSKDAVFVAVNHPEAAKITSIRAYSSDLSELKWEIHTQLEVEDSEHEGTGPYAMALTPAGNILVSQYGSREGWALSLLDGVDGKLLKGSVEVVEAPSFEPPGAADADLANLPVQALRPLTDVVQIAGDCALVKDGTVWCWGVNSRGRFNNEEIPRARYAVKVPGIDSAVAFHQNSTSFCVILEDRTVRCWGMAVRGGVGNPDAGTGITSPVSPFELKDVLELSMGWQAACAVLGDRTIKCWGAGSNDTIVHRKFGDDALVPEVIENVGDVYGIGVGESHACVHNGAFEVSCWGLNNAYDLGTAEAALNTKYEPPNILSFDAKVIQVVDTCALLETGRMWCWGTGGGGLSTSLEYDREYQGGPYLLELSNVRHIIPGNSHCVLQGKPEAPDENQILCWDANFPQYPDSHRFVMEELGHVIDYDSLVGSSCALRADGTVWCSDGTVLAEPANDFVLSYPRHEATQLYAGDLDLLH